MRDVVSLYPIDLQKLSPETGSPSIEYCDEFSERRTSVICYPPGWPLVAKIPCQWTSRFTPLLECVFQH